MGKKQKGDASGVNFCCGHRPVVGEEELRTLRRKRVERLSENLKGGGFAFHDIHFIYAFLDLKV